MLLRILGKFVYSTLPKCLGMLLVYPKRMAVGIKPKEAKEEEHNGDADLVEVDGKLLSAGKI